MKGIAAFVLGALATLVSPADGAAANAQSAHAFSFTGIDGTPLPLASFAGKAVMVVNTASRCGFTGQYSELQALWDRYRDRGLVVVGVPSNDFGGQEPGTEAEIKTFCAVNFDVDFPLTMKQHVTGERAHPFYRWAAAELGAGAKPRWNFHKYLIAPDGRLADWFSTMTPPTAQRVIEAVEALLPRAATTAETSPAGE
jgi:glutathione peroxidase